MHIPRKIGEINTRERHKYKHPHTKSYHTHTRAHINCRKIILFSIHSGTRGAYSHIPIDGLCRPKGYTFSATSVPEWVSYYCIFEKSPWKGIIFVWKSLSGYHFSKNFASKSPKGYQFQRNLVPSPWQVPDVPEIWAAHPRHVPIQVLPRALEPPPNTRQLSTQE